MKKHKLLLWLAISLLAIPMACDEKESPIGIGLQDPATLYNGIKDTVLLSANTFLDDSLVTSQYTAPVIGNYRDQIFGSVHAALFTQIGMNDDNGIIFDESCHIDSTVLTLVVSEVYPLESRRSQPIHFRVDQLAQPLPSDSTYYHYDQFPVSRICFFDGNSNVVKGDSATLVSLRLNNQANLLFQNKSYRDNEAFMQAAKGIRISIIEGSESKMLTLNLAASKTKLTVHYKSIHGTQPGDTIFQTKDFQIGSAMTHFNQIQHTYSGALSIFNRSHTDSIAGSQYLYFDPLGGTFVKINFDNFVANFHRDHPYAIIHYAELLLPVADIAQGNLPSKIIARKSRDEGDYISDMIDAFTYAGFDGAYDRRSGCYRLRITQHFQSAVSKGHDSGTYLFLNTRRYSPKRTIINGTQASNPCRIEFVYTELSND